MNKYNDEVQTVLALPLAQALLTIDTRDSLRSKDGFYTETPQNPFDINVYKGQNFVDGAIKRIAIKEISLPWNIPNVNERNFRLYIDVLTGPSTFNEFDIQIVPGFYTAPELALAVAAELNAGSVGGVTTWTCTYDAANVRFTITTGTGTVFFRINPKIGVYLPDVEETTLAEMMGFQTTSKSFVNDFILGSYANMLYTSYVDIVSDIITKNQDVRDASTSFNTGQQLLARVYIAPQAYTVINADGSSVLGTRPFYMHYQWQVPKEIGWNPEESLPTFRIQLRDDKGQLLYVQNPSTVDVSPNYIQCGNTAFVQMTLSVSEARGK
jgi:hypothetical protein